MNSGWMAHKEIQNFVQQCAIKGFESCEAKLRNARQTDDSYLELVGRKEVFQTLMNKSSVHSAQPPAVHIARQEFSNKGIIGRIK